ncbi:hypothetical protein DFJ77DRAFT_455786 [Powellomyces hirtus]|nr:hypothetical protein DFJ77DRAFT_455786 [Powellomyces hirtus]
MSYNSMKPGDWLCEACNCHNFQSRNVCFRCNAPRDLQQQGASHHGGSYGGGAPSGHGMRPGDWICEKPGCNFQNFASRHECMRCGSLPPQSGGQTHGGGNGGGMGHMHGGPPPHQKQYAEFRPGDWGCDLCKFHNFQSRSECYKCGAPRPQGHMGGPAGGNGMPYGGMGGGAGMGGGQRMMPPTLKPGDWLCPSCQVHNFRSRVECFRCRTPMPQGGGGPHDEEESLAPPGTEQPQQYGQSLFSQGHEFGIGTYPPGTEQYNPEWRG